MGPPSVRHKAAIAAVKTKRQIRRVQYAQAQKLYATKRKDCAETVLSGDWRTAHEPTLRRPNSLRGFWSQVFDQPSMPDPRPVEAIASKWSMLVPIAADEVTEVLKQMGQTAPSLDRVTTITIGAIARIRMKVPWPAAFEDGDVRMFLEEFEDVEELTGIRTDRGKLTALPSLLKGRARAVLDAARRSPEKMEWAAAKDALIAGFDTPADRQEALRRFKMAQLGLEQAEERIRQLEFELTTMRISSGSNVASREVRFVHQADEGYVMPSSSRLKFAPDITLKPDSMKPLCEAAVQSEMEY
ncbi:unnamed protein product [Echinostoma caproni]|uniref:Uncharacterized protein n=1 Tax=Echinostoma caproni TaxID=27848 RepID=A0A183B963_9TREM|nr:unnamed protein product [Echinostoma caproni]